MTNEIRMANDEVRIGFDSRISVGRPRSSEISPDWSLPVHGSDRYTIGMKTAVSIPDRVFKDAERFAREHSRSRSELYSDAVRQYLMRHSSDSVTEAMNRLCEGLETQDDGFVRAASRQALRRQTW